MNYVVYGGYLPCQRHMIDTHMTIHYLYMVSGLFADLFNSELHVLSSSGLCRSQGAVISRFFSLTLLLSTIGRLRSHGECI
jgi:hypothetical protein